jgi:hypothetical protein
VHRVDGSEDWLVLSAELPRLDVGPCEGQAYRELEQLALAPHGRDRLRTDEEHVKWAVEWKFQIGSRFWQGRGATIIASIAALCVTWMFSSRQAKIADAQRRIAAAKLDFDLYEKRYAAFEAARKLWREVVQHGNVEMSQMDEFMIGTVDAEFLFGNDVVQYLEKFREKVARLQTTQSRLELTKDQNKRGNLANFKKKHFTDLTEEYEKMKAVFKPYLNVSERLKG